MLAWAVDENDEVISRLEFTGMGEELPNNQVGGSPGGAGAAALLS